VQHVHHDGYDHGDHAKAAHHGDVFGLAKQVAGPGRRRITNTRAGARSAAAWSASALCPQPRPNSWLPRRRRPAARPISTATLRATPRRPSTVPPFPELNEKTRCRAL
jgi:hypothetical protein